DVLPVPSLRPPSARCPEASGAGGEPKACCQTGAHASGVCHHCCCRIPRDHARKRAHGTTVLTAFDNPIPLSLQYGKGGGGASYFPMSAITDRLYARNQVIQPLERQRFLLQSLMQRGHQVAAAGRRLLTAPSAASTPAPPPVRPSRRGRGGAS